MTKKNICNKFMRGNIQLSSKSVNTIKIKACCGCMVLFLAIFFSIKWINWDATVIFYKPDLNDIKIGFTKEIMKNTLHTRRWKEKQAYMEDIFTSACEKYDYSLLTNLNIKVLGYRISDSICFKCDNKKLYVNLRITPRMSGKRLICNETYGNAWVIKKDRYHPLKYSYINKETLNRESHKTISYEETCLFYQANDLLQGTWTI